MSWVPGTYGFQTRAAYDREVARKQEEGIPLTQSYIPSPAPKIPSTPSNTGSSMTAAEKAASLGTVTIPGGSQMSAADWMSDPGAWGDPSAYQKFMSGYQNLPTSGGGTTTTVTPPQQTYYQTDPAVVATLNELKSAIANMPTVDSVMSSPATQQMLQAIMGQADQAFKKVKASAAGNLVLGEGSTPAAERMGQVAGYYGQQLGALIPQMMGAASQMQGAQINALQNLVSLLSGMDQQSWQRGITEFQNYAPYYRLTAAEEAGLTQWILNTFPQLSPEDVSSIVNSFRQGGY